MALLIATDGLSPNAPYRLEKIGDKPPTANTAIATPFKNVAANLIRSL
jgi:hypothetical protein